MQRIPKNTIHFSHVKQKKLLFLRFTDRDPLFATQSPYTYSALTCPAAFRSNSSSAAQFLHPARILMVLPRMNTDEHGFLSALICVHLRPAFLCGRRVAFVHRVFVDFNQAREERNRIARGST
jgi:hypothetical protein